MRYQSKRDKRQFLAGVRCPSCGTLDVVQQIQIFTPAADEYIECTHCGHKERRPSAQDVQSTDTNTTSMQPVRFVTPESDPNQE